jgi:hypothetical protein
MVHLRLQMRSHADVGSQAASSPLLLSMKLAMTDARESAIGRWRASGAAERLGALVELRTVGCCHGRACRKRRDYRRMSVPIRRRLG